MPSPTAHPRVEELTRPQCLELLARHDFGRLAVVLEEQQPDIFPVNYVLDGDRVVFRTLIGTKLEHASLDKVAFEIDERSPGVAASVVVKGIAREITTAIDPDSERQRDLPIHSPLQGDHWVRIVPSEITGRRMEQQSASRPG